MSENAAVDETVFDISGMIDIPTRYGVFKMGLVDNAKDQQPHVVLSLGQIARRGVLTRIHSECLTGDVFGSFRCDCRDQLSKSLRQIGAEGAGVLIYLRQEGRGIGLANKLKAYGLQDRGWDTIDANIELGLPVDARSYQAAAHALRELGVNSIRLMTNNPEKIAALYDLGICVEERVPLIGEKRVQSERYVATKIERLGHLIDHT